MITGQFISSIDKPVEAADYFGWSSYGWGDASAVKVYASAALDMGLLDDTSWLDDLLNKFATRPPNFDLENLIGPQGLPGPAGPPGPKGPPGTGLPRTSGPWVGSNPYTPPRRISHNTDKLETDTTLGNATILWQELARVFIYWGTDVDAKGWARIVNDSGSDRTVTLWMERRPDDQEKPDPGLYGGTDIVVSNIVVGTVPANSSVYLRVSAVFSVPSAMDWILSLFGRPDAFEPSLYAKGNNAGISGKNLYDPRYGI